MPIAIVSKVPTQATKTAGAMRRVRRRYNHWDHVTVGLLGGASRAAFARELLGDSIEALRYIGSALQLGKGSALQFGKGSIAGSGRVRTALPVQCQCGESTAPDETTD